MWPARHHKDVSSGTRVRDVCHRKTLCIHRKTNAKSLHCMICVSVSDRMVSLCVCWPDDEAEGEVVLSALYTGEKEETVARRRHTNVALCVTVQYVICVALFYIVIGLHANIVVYFYCIASSR